MAVNEQDWRIRHYVYRFFVEHERPPSYAETAHACGIADGTARAAYRRLHAAHAIFLAPGSDAIRMANPLSAVPTAYRVHVHGRRLYANCAWDSLGIPAMLGADATINAAFAHTGEPVQYTVAAGRLTAQADALVHFALPFRRWYDDLIHT